MQVTFLYFVGMCMCLSFFTIPTTDKPVLITGYENGQLLLWDVMEQKIMSTKTVHNETGTHENNVSNKFIFYSFDLL